MGQALRRASGKLKNSGVNISPSSKQTVPNQTLEQVRNVERKSVYVDNRAGDANDPETVPTVNNDNLLEERDLEYDAMLDKMAGRIKTKPGGKPEMGEAFIVEKYNRPLPKLRTSKTEISGDESNTPPGTLDIVKIKQILLLHEGKSEEHQGPLDVDAIAKKFMIDAAQVHKILRFVSLPPEGK